MVVFEDVYKRYVTNHEAGEWVLRGVSLAIPAGARVGIVGNKGSGKSTLLRLIEGLESPTEGRVECAGRVVTPAKYVRTFQPLLTGRQNSKFIIRISGYADEIEERLAKVEELAGLGEEFNKPTGVYKQMMKLALSRALSLALDCEIYISDGVDLSGDKIEKVLQNLNKRTGLIMTAKGAQSLANLKRFCKAGILVHEGSANWFDSLDDALEAYKKIQPLAPSKIAGGHSAANFAEQLHPKVTNIKNMQYILAILSKGLHGVPETVAINKISVFAEMASNAGIELVTVKQAAEHGYVVKTNVVPILRSVTAGGELMDYFDLQVQCDNVRTIE